MLVVMLGITVLFMNGKSLGIVAATDEDSENYTGDTVFTANDLDGSWYTGLEGSWNSGLTHIWNNDGAVRIDLNGSSASVSGNGAYSLDGDVVIARSGRYIVSGTLDDGSLIVDAENNSKIWILFDNVQVSCSDNAAVIIDQADKVFLTLADGSENALSDGSAYGTGASGEVNAALYARDDLTINGSGALTINGNYKHGIKANDDLVITGGTIAVHSVSDAVHVNESFRFTGADLTVNAGDDAIHADKSVGIYGGSILINTCYEGIESPAVDIADGDVTIYPTDDGINANGGSGTAFIAPAVSGASADAAVSAASDASAPYIHITGGSLTIVNETARDADGLDSNSDILIDGGTVRISLSGNGSNSAIDYGSETGGKCLITGGTVIACGSYTMAEGFDSDSAQCSVLYNLSGGAEAGTAFSLEDKDGNVLLSWDVPCSFSSVNVSCPEMQQGETYRVVIGENAEEITLDESSASFGDAQSSMFGGKMNWGGMAPRGAGTGPDGSSDRGGGRRRGRESGTESAEGSGAETAEGTGEAPDFSAFGGDMPATAGSGEMPAPPDFGNMPDSGENMTEMPAPPDSGENMPAPPNFNGGMPDAGGFDSGSGVHTAQETADSNRPLSEYPVTTFAMTGAAALILIMGVGVAVWYKQ